MEDGLQPGDLVAGKLEVIRKIAGGGMGAVYEVEHKLTKHRRALKILHKSQATNRRYVERLLREASVAGRLDTPYVVETLDAGLLEDGSPYLLMELLRGVALLECMEREAPLGAARTVRIIRQVCEGMAAAHDAGIIHRDLKPENILVDVGPDGEERVKIIDFGISRFRELEGDGPVSRLTTEGTIIGTPYYMSPEQASGKDVDARTDVYALGVILYEMLTGRLPFIAETTGALFIKIGTGEYLPLRHRRRDIEPGFADVVERAFHRDAAQRFAGARELSEALAPYADGPAGARKPKRATADYESDRPRPLTRPGVAPEAAQLEETMDIDAAVPLQKSFAVRGHVRAPVVPAAARPVVSHRDAPTEEVTPKESVPSARAPAGKKPQRDEVAPSGRPAASTPSYPPDSDPAPKRVIPDWLGTTSLSAVIAALISLAAIGIVALALSDGDDGDPTRPPPVVQDSPERDAPAHLREVVDPVDVEEPEVEDPPEKVNATGPDEEDDPRPSMMGRGMMSMRTAAEAAGLETDPYGP